MDVDSKADLLVAEREGIRLMDGHRQMVAVESLAKTVGIHPQRVADILGIEHRYFESWYARGGN